MAILAKGARKLSPTMPQYVQPYYSSWNQEDLFDTQCISTCSAILPQLTTRTYW